jgi:hypothetical protein
LARKGAALTINDDAAAWRQALSYHLVGSNEPCEDVLLMHHSDRGERPALYAVIDGHGGRWVADHVQRQLPVEFDRALADGLLPGAALEQALATVEASVLHASASNKQVPPGSQCTQPQPTVRRLGFGAALATVEASVLHASASNKQVPPGSQCTQPPAHCEADST